MRKRKDESVHGLSCDCDSNSLLFSERGSTRTAKGPAGSNSRKCGSDPAADRPERSQSKARSPFSTTRVGAFFREARIGDARRGMVAVVLLASGSFVANTYLEVE